MRRFAAIPAHPQKQYTRLWRLYHFCGFYYPIREVIPIAIYHWNIGIVSRGKGKSAVAAAAYRSGEKLTNEWDGMTHDYTRKGGVAHTEIMLPPHAPPSFSDRSTLWNSVELYEKAGNAQLAREIDAALPIELSREEQIRLVREYCSSQFVSRGMCVDFVIHDTNSGNPHCHIMLTMRPLDERGAWAAKSKKEYDLDENGERIRLPSGRYKTHKVDLTGWNDKGNALLWRKAWADISNAYLERAGSPERIDHRSNAERGIDELPTVHMGVAACQMEKKGIATEKGELNRNIQKANRLIREIRAQIGKLKEWIGELFKARETAPEQPPQSPGLANLLMKYLSVQREKSRKYSQRWQQQHTADELKTIAAAVNYLSEDADMLAAEAAYCELEQELQYELDHYEALHPGYDEYRFDLDEIEHDPYVLISILTAFHEGVFTIDEVQEELQMLFEKQYILTQTVEVEVRYRTETRTDSEGNDYDVEVPYNYYICNVKLENFDLSHVPVYIMDEETLSLYAVYMATLGNREDLFPGSGYVDKYTKPPTTYDIPPSALEDETFAALITEAEKYIGYPYVWGGSNPNTSFDCSGFVSWALTQSGVCNTGRLGAQGLYNISTPVSSANAIPGDLIFFVGTYDTPGVSHVGIYVGGGKMLHCGDPIQYADINTSYWQSHFYAFGRPPYN